MNRWGEEQYYFEIIIRDNQVLIFKILQAILTNFTG